MVAEAERHGAHLGRGRGGVGVVLRELRAAGHEVLPDENAVRIAPVVEFVGLVDAAAPNAHEVAVALLDELERRHNALGLPRGNGVGWNPVGAADVDWLAVHAEEKLAGTVRPVHVVAHELDGAEANPTHIAREHGAAGLDDFDGRVVERVVARAGRPPEVEARRVELDAVLHRVQRTLDHGNGRDARSPTPRQLDRDAHARAIEESLHRRLDAELRADAAAVRRAVALTAPVVVGNPRRVGDAHGGLDVERDGAP